MAPTQTPDAVDADPCPRGRQGNTDVHVRSLRMAKSSLDLFMQTVRRVLEGQSLSRR